jgi:hypothetical protein
MSIHDAVWGLLNSGKLVHRPSSLLEISARDVFVTPAIFATAHRPFADTEKGERDAELSNFLDAFSEMNHVSVSESPGRKPPEVMLARVAPTDAEFWSMRIIEPDDTAGMRVLGAFCWKDGFVGLTCEYRDKIPPGQFHTEVQEVRDAWHDLFGTIVPHSGGSLDDYLSNYYVLRL